MGNGSKQFETFVIEQGKHAGARSVYVTLSQQVDIDNIPEEISERGRLFAYPPRSSPIGQNVLRRYKAIETLYNQTLLYCGEEYYTWVLLMRDDIYWYRHLVMPSLS